MMESNHFYAVRRSIALSGPGKKEPQLIEYCYITTATMSNTTFNRKNRTKKGISPVIATVILVAVAVVIAAALAGFASSLFGTYSSAGGAVTVKSITVNPNGDYAISLQNGGNVADQLTSVQALPNAPVTDFATVDSDPAGAVDGRIAPGQTTEVEQGADALGTFNAGQVITVKLTMNSGLALTQSVVVTN
jgi:flagellin-like protein